MVTLFLDQGIARIDHWLGSNATGPNPGTRHGLRLSATSWPPPKVHQGFTQQ
jgi:hypothetical protein